MVFDADGHFLLEGVAPGAYRVEVGASGLAPSVQRTEIVAGLTTQLRFTLDEGAHVRGRVIDAATAKGDAIAFSPVEGDGSRRNGPALKRKEVTSRHQIPGQ